MTLSAGPVPTRRRLRETAENAVAAEPAPASEPVPATDAEASVDPRRAVPRRQALGWVDAAVVGAQPHEELVDGDLLARRPHRSPLRPGVLLPFVLVLALVGVYVATTALWPLNALTPTVVTSALTPTAAPAATPAWPGAGSAAVAVQGFDGTLSTSDDPVAIASITKVVTALMVLDQMPLAVGEQGPEFRFDDGDEYDYYAYLDEGESALDVPVDGTLTEYQLLQGMLIGSANNYAERLAGYLWPNDTVFANAAAAWLGTHGVQGITVVDPTGIEEGNQASAAALIPLAQKALANPVIAQIVGSPAAVLPGAGAFGNTNQLLGDAGVVGVKTGTLDGYNVLAAKDVTIGATTVRLYASVMNQPDDASRFAVARALFDELTAELQPFPSVTAGTRVGVVQTAWGATSDVLASADASVVEWNGAAATATPDIALGDHRSADDVVGSLTVTGPLDASTVDVHLAADIEGPSLWWRLTHPLQLFGLAG